MPKNTSTELTAEQRELAKVWFKEKCRLEVCPSCKENLWEIYPEIYEMRSFAGGALVIGGQARVLPLVILQCQKCANMRFYNAIGMGLLDPKDYEDSEEKEKIKAEKT